MWIKLKEDIINLNNVCDIQKKDTEDAKYLVISYVNQHVSMYSYSNRSIRNTIYDAILEYININMLNL